MPFDDLTSNRVRQLLLTLLREFDPERYTSFIAHFAFGGGGGVLLIGARGMPELDLEGLKGNIDRGDFLELRDARYIRLEEKGDGTLEGRLTKRAYDEFAEEERLSHVRRPVTSGDPAVDTLAQRLTGTTLRGCSERQAKRLEELKMDMLKRGLLGSGIEEQQNVGIAIQFMDEYVEGMQRELVGLVRTLGREPGKRDADWIQSWIGEDLDSLKRGQAGCYVKDPFGQRRLGDYIQRKKAAVASDLRIVVETAELKARAQAIRDVFISHASEDKDVARPIAEALRAQGIKVWYDEYEIKLGDSIPRKIDEGLGSRFGVVVLSPSFFSKNWPKTELEALLQRENDEGVKIVLPIWHQLDAEDVKRHSKMLATKRAAIMSKGVEAVVAEVVEAVQAGKAT